MASSSTTSSSANSVALVVPEILTGDNYANWSIWMEIKLSVEDLWDVVESSQNDGAGREKNAAALHTIQYWCCSEIWPSISSTNNISSAKDAWDEIAKKYGVVVSGNDNQSQFLDSGSQSSQENSDYEDYDDIESYITADENLPSDAGIVENRSRSGLLTLLKAIYGICGDLADVRKLFKKPSPLTAKVRESYKTFLHTATSVGDAHIVEILMEHTSIDHLLVPDESGNTAMSCAAQFGNTQIAKCLYDKNKNLIINVNRERKCPVVMASNSGCIDTARYLYSITPIAFLLSDNGIHGSELLSGCILYNMFDIAFHLIGQMPELVVAKDRGGRIPMEVLFNVPSLYWSGSKLSFWEGWIYSRLKVKQSIAPNENEVFKYTSGREKTKGENIISKAIKRIYNLKKNHGNAREFLGKVCEYTSSKLDSEQLVQSGVLYAVFEAAKQGITEPIIEIFKANPDLISSYDVKRRDIFKIATIYRQEKVFSLIYGFDTRKKALLASVDNYDNSLLHLAANLGDEAKAKLTQISGAALQMQRELQWFKEMEDILPETHKQYINKDRKTPKQVFDETHTDLAKEGQEWMKKIASSSTVVGTLIMTIMFAAAFTVPGGYDQNIGFPLFLTSGHNQYYEQALMIFIISDAISLFTSSTSVLMFLGILTSRYAMEDFLKSLPNKLIIALSTLFISIATMMVAFCAGLIIMLEGRSWITIPIILLATIPITLFAWLQFPLLVKICFSTYGAGIFDRKMKLWT